MTVLDELRAFLSGRNEQAYLVGGALRDLLLGRENHDLDLVVVATAAPLARAFADQVGGAFYVMDAEHDVSRVLLERDGARDIVDFARLRGESIEQDLGTRDFSVNSMAVVLDEPFDTRQIVDPFNGRDDLAARRVRPIYSDVFANDPVRLLRAVRFEAELGFRMDAQTEALVRRDASKLSAAPQERARDEFVRIIAAANVERQLRRLDALFLLNVVLPELAATKGVTQSPPHVFDVFEHSVHAAGALEVTQASGYSNIAEGAFTRELAGYFSATISADRSRAVFLRIVALLHDIGKPATRTQAANGRIHFYAHEELGAEMIETALRRLRFSNDEIDLAATVVQHHLRPILLAAEEHLGDRAVHRYFRATGDLGIDVAVHSWADHLAIYGDSDHASSDAAQQAVLTRLLDRYYRAHEKIVEPPPLLNGYDVMSTLQIAPGKRVGELLEAVREAQATGEVKTREQAVEFIKRRANY